MGYVLAYFALSGLNNIFISLIPEFHSGRWVLRPFGT